MLPMLILSTFRTFNDLVLMLLTKGASRATGAALVMVAALFVAAAAPAVAAAWPDAKPAFPLIAQSGSSGFVDQNGVPFFKVDLTQMSGTSVKAWIFDPSTGSSTSAGTFPTTGSQAFQLTGPQVLVLDDEAARRPRKFSTCRSPTNRCLR